MQRDQPIPESGASYDWVAITSYVPLLYGEPGRVVGIDDPEFLTLLARIEDCPSGQADAFLWLADREAAIQPVFVLDRAAEVSDHLLDWCEHRPGDWFSLCLMEHNDRFAAALVPNLAQTISRFEAVRHARGGRASVANGYDLLLRPLFFVSQPRPAYGQVRHLITDTVRVGLLDTDDFAAAHPPSLALERVRTVGPVPVCRDARPFGFDARPLLRRVFAWATEPDPE